MRFEYDFSVFPPMPVLEISIASIHTGKTYGPRRAIIDTGADATIVPIKAVRAIEAKAIATARLWGYTGGYRRVLLYLVDIRIGDMVLPGVEIVGDPAASELLVGRDVLNKLRIVLDGPRGFVEV